MGYDVCQGKRDKSIRAKGTGISGQEGQICLHALSCMSGQEGQVCLHGL